MNQLVILRAVFVIFVVHKLFVYLFSPVSVLDADGFNMFAIITGQLLFNFHSVLYIFSFYQGELE
jgi:hypothetical protein